MDCWAFCLPLWPLPSRHFLEINYVIVHPSIFVMLVYILKISWLINKICKFTFFSNLGTRCGNSVLSRIPPPPVPRFFLKSSFWNQIKNIYLYVFQTTSYNLLLIYINLLYVKHPPTVSLRGSPKKRIQHHINSWLFARIHPCTSRGTPRRASEWGATQHQQTVHGGIVSLRSLTHSRCTCLLFARDISFLASSSKFSDQKTCAQHVLRAQKPALAQLAARTQPR